MSGGRDVARAIDSLRRGWTIVVDGTSFLAIETADQDTLAAFDAAGTADLLVSGHRAVTLKLANQRDGVPTGAVRIARGSSIGLGDAIAIANPVLDLGTPLKGPFKSVADPAPSASAAALRLARRAGLFPAFFVGGRADSDAVMVSAAAVERLEADPRLTIASRARLPNRFSEQSEIVAFRSAEDAADHIALVIGTPDDTAPLVRLHSECLTGDVLGSLKCDCGAQLDAALTAVAGSGWGILLYLRQEGRAIGLVNKLRAYQLQDQGFDTVDANIRLGFADDERDFGVAAAMLRLLGRDAVRLLTNNLRKVDGLEAEGIAVLERVPLRVAENVHNAAYLATKKARSGHQL